MVLQCEWAQIQVIVLTNDGNGFGFGISGSRNSGAVVRNIFPGGAADRDGNLENGDHLLAVGDVRLWGMGAEQVASILRQAGQDSIRLIVARPVDPTVQNVTANSAIVQTKVLTDPAELENIMQSGLQAAAGIHSGHASANGYSFDTPSGFGAENFQSGATDIIPPEAAQVMSLASVDPGSNSALPTSAPILVISPAISGRDDEEKNKAIAKSTEASPILASFASSLQGATSLESSNNKEKETIVGHASEQLSTDNIALPLRRPSVEIVRPLHSQEGKISSPVLSPNESKSGNPVETFVTTKNSSEKPHHVVLQKEGSKSPSSLAQSISPDGVSHTKTLIQVHTPSSSKNTSNTGSVVSECEKNRSLPSTSNPISGGQKVTLVTRQNDPDHVSIVLNPSSCSTTSEIIATAVAASTSSNVSSETVDGGKNTHQENKSVHNNDNVSSSTSFSHSSGSRKAKRHGRKASKDNLTSVSNTSNEEIIGTGVFPSKKSRKATSKSPVDKSISVYSSANDKDVTKGVTIKSDICQTKTPSFSSVSQCQKTQAGCSSCVGKVDTSGAKSDSKQEVAFINEGKKCKDELRLPLNENKNHNQATTTERSIRDPNRTVVCSSDDVELVPANVINNSVLPEKEEYKIELEKDEKGLGITVAGYICEKEDLCGIFVKSVIEDSMADRSGSIMVNDQITEVDDVQLGGYTNQEAVEILKRTGKVVKLSIVRYLRGLKFEELQEGITQANVATPTSPYPQTPGTPHGSKEDILLSADDRLNTSFQVTTSASFDRDQPSFKHASGNESSINISKAINQLTNTQNILSKSTPNYPTSSSYNPTLEESTVSQSNNYSSNGNTTQPESFCGDAVLGSETIPSTTGISFDRKAHHDNIVKNRSNHPTYNNLVLSQKTSGQNSTLTISNKNSISLDEPSYNSATNTSSKARHSVPNVLDSEGHIPMILPLSSHNYNYPNNISHLSTGNHDNITAVAIVSNERIPNSDKVKPLGKRVNSKTNSNLNRSLGANDNGAVKHDNDDKDYLQFKWETIVGSKFKVVVAKLRKPGENSGLGIALEGTVEVEDGREVRPHHYIRDIQIGGPVGLNGMLQRGDELLEVNGCNLDGLFHHDVVKCLKELPLDVCIVIARQISGPSPLRGTIVNNVDPGKSRQAFASRKILSGSLQSLLASKETDLLLKAKSEVSLSCNTFSHSLSLSCSITNTAAAVDSREKEFINDRENKTLKNSASADQIAGNHAVVNLSQDSKALTSVPCSSILSTKTSYTSGTSAISPIESFPIVTGSSSASAPIHKEISVPLDLYSKYAEKNRVGRNEDVKAQYSAKSSLTSSNLTEQSRRISKSLEPLNTTAMWEKTTEEVVLTKGEKGLGFSILDYQDPLNTAETVIVVRSVVPGGIAQVDGRLLPGDRIMYVNDTSLDTHTSLDCAVQALKGAQFGPVKIGIARPINFEDDKNPSCDTKEKKHVDTLEKCKVNEVDAKADQEISSGKTKQLSVSLSQNVLSTKSTTASASNSFCTTTTTTTERSERESASDTFAEGSNLSDWKTDYGTDNLDHDDSSTVDDKASEPKLIASPFNVSPVSITAHVPGISSATSLSPKSPSVLNKRGSLTTVLNLPILPHLPKYSLIIKKAHSDFLGIQLEALAYELCGTVIRKVEDNSVVARDGRLRAGDLVLYLNHECMWRVTCSQAKTILRRAELVSSGIPVVFVPEESLIDGSDATSQDEQSEGESLSESLKLSDIHEDTKEKETGSSSKTSISSEEIVPDLTVKSASSTNILTRFPSDLLETSVDPDNDTKISLTSDSPKLVSSKENLKLVSTSEESFNQNVDVIDSNQNQFDLHGKQQLNVRKEDGLKPTTDSAKSLEINSVFESKDRVETLNASLGNSINTEHQVIRKADVVPTENVHVTTSTLTTTNHLVNIVPSLKKNKELKEKYIENDNNVSSSLMSLSNQHVKMEEIVNSSTKTSFEGKQEQHVSEKPSFDLTKEEGHNTTHKNSSVPHYTSSSMSSQIDGFSASINAVSVVPKKWGPVRIVEIPRHSLETGLGVSIVGGNVESIAVTEHYNKSGAKVYSEGRNPEIDGVISGIFIKSILSDSPAGRTGQLFTGDHLVQVDDIKLTTSDQHVAVQAIKNAGNPVRLKLRSLMQQQISINPSSKRSQSEIMSSSKDVVQNSSQKFSTIRDVGAIDTADHSSDQAKFKVQTEQYPDNTNVRNTSLVDQETTHSTINTNLEISDPAKILDSNLVECGEGMIHENTEDVPVGKDVSYLAFKAVDTSSRSGTPTPRKNCSNGSNHSYGASGNFTTANSICTLHAVTDLEQTHVTDASAAKEREDDSSALMSSYSDIRTLANKPDTKATTLAPSFSIPTRNTKIIDQLYTNEHSDINESLMHQSTGDENPFQNDRLPIWQMQPQFQSRSSYDTNKVDSDPGSPSTTTSSAISLSYNHSNDARKQNITAYSSSSPEYNSQFDGYHYKQLNETPTSPELLAYRQQQQQQFGTNCLPSLSNNKTTTTNSNFHDPIITISAIPQHPGTPQGIQEESNKIIEVVSSNEKLNEIFSEKDFDFPNGEIIDIELERNEYGFGLALSGHKNRDTMGTFICGIHPKGSAAEEGSLQPGDELVKFHETMVCGRSHLNVSALIKQVPNDVRVQVVAVRHKNDESNSAIRNFTNFTNRLDDVIFLSEEFNKFQAKREIKIKKSMEGLGIMIIEGSHKSLGKGIYISDIQKNSLAFKAKLKVGDMLLAVNTESFLTINYDEAALILKQVTGNIRLLVVNPNDEIEAQNRLIGCVEQDSPDDQVKTTREQEKSTPEQSTNEQKRDIRKISVDATTKSVIGADEPKSSEQKFEDINVELSKSPGKGLGLSVVGRRDGCGVFISDMVLGGSADVGGHILRGDQIMSVNGLDLSQAKQDEAVAILKVSEGNVKIKVRRHKGTIK